MIWGRGREAAPHGVGTALTRRFILGREDSTLGSKAVLRSNKPAETTPCTTRGCFSISPTTLRSRCGLTLAYRSISRTSSSRFTKCTTGARLRPCGNGGRSSIEVPARPLTSRIFELCGNGSARGEFAVNLDPAGGGRDGPGRARIPAMRNRRRSRDIAVRSRGWAFLTSLHWSGI